MFVDAIAGGGGLIQLPALLILLPGVPVATVSIGGGRNAGLLAVRILAAADERLRSEVARFQADLADQVLARDAALQQTLGTPPD